MRSKATMTGKLLAQTMHGRPHGPGLRPPAANKKLRALTDCPTCRATGKVESRLPFRQKTCHDCGGRARVTPTKREQILQRTATKGPA